MQYKCQNAIKYNSWVHRYFLFSTLLFAYLKFFIIKIAKISKDEGKAQVKLTISILLSKQNDGYRVTKQDGGLTSVMCLVTQESSPPLLISMWAGRLYITDESKTVKVLWKIALHLLLNVCVAKQFHSRLSTSKLVCMPTKIYVEIFIAVHS